MSSGEQFSFKGQTFLLVGKFQVRAWLNILSCESLWGMLSTDNRAHCSYLYTQESNTQEMINSLELISVGNSHCCKCLEWILYGKEFNLTVGLFFYEVCVVRMFSKHRFLKHKLKKCSKELQKVALSSHC